ncbi:hypothetical protein BX666DRAFT_1567192 [Dichotomocladium elegans]|nr:hypothetical protein BX666DRAFT_1567192 [Dichotomocladium elegans]
MTNLAAVDDPLELIASTFRITRDKMEAIVDGFKSECTAGLRTESAKGLSTMIPSYVTRMPTGEERGTFLSLDLGGSNLRVSAVNLLGHGQVTVSEVKRTITDVERTSTVTHFFDWIAEAVEELIGKHTHRKEPLAMGICWSFPLDQTSIDSGTILRMGKGFTLDGIEGKNLRTLFHEAFNRKKINVVVTAVLNDTVGTLVAHAYSNPGASVGFIYGTGVNAAYPERVSRIRKLGKLTCSESAPDDIMLVNTEIDIFGNESYLPLTRFDRALDELHSQPKFQPYEKMMSGAYLGELVRLIAVELTTEHQYMFCGKVPKQLSKPWIFTTEAASNIERLGDSMALSEFNQWVGCMESESTEEDLRRFVRICALVSSRAAVLAAAAMAAIVEQQDILASSPTETPIIIGITGSTYEKYPAMPERIHQALRDWFGDAVARRIRLDVAKEGSSVGGALIAMLYHNDQRHVDSEDPKSTCFISCLPFSSIKNRLYNLLSWAGSDPQSHATHVATPSSEKSMYL